MYVDTVDGYKYGSLRRVYRLNSKIESISPFTHYSNLITLHFDSGIFCVTSDKGELDWMV